MNATIPTFQNPDLFTTAMTHRSSLNENLSSATQSNERLEYLGDAVLELATTKFLYNKFPNKSEGELTAFRSALVKTTTLAQVARELELGEKLFMSKGEEASNGRKNVGILANTVEAVIGALYVDQGFEAVEEFLSAHLFPKFERIYQEKLYIDAKSLLQEVVQSKGFATPEYRVVSENGPDHNKEFTVEVIISNQPRGEGTGKSKQSAQQAAAKKALPFFENI